MVFIRRHYGDDRFRLPFNTVGDTMTEQSHKEACDVNNIVKRAQLGATVLQRTDGFYADVSVFSGSYHDAMNQLLEAKESFMELPSDIRKRFDNDPGKFLEFATNPDNLDEMREMGLANKDPSPPPEPANEPDQEEE